MKKLPLALVVVTKNEENHIERCLRSVPFASDVVVLDSGSEDRTLILARECGARVFVEEWRGFGPQKKRGAELAEQDWILSLDADEALSPELAEEISRLFETLDPHTGYLLPRRSFHLGRWIDHGGWRPDRQLRLFNRRHSQWNEARVHEKVVVEKTARLNEPILHWVFDDLSDQVITNDKYSSLQARALFDRGVRFSLWKLIFKPWGKFLETYFFKRGFMDGLPGFIISVGAAYSLFLRFAKLWELEQRRKRR